jgi:glucuronoarabinoxylan endo-1,4-beta-xylanase
VTLGQTATFTVVATGTAPLSYQWQKNGASIAGATATSYTTPGTTTADSGATFRVVVSNTAGTVTSAAATLTVNNSTPDTTPPTVSIAAPTNGATVSGVAIVSGTASDNVAVSSVQVSVDNGNFSNASGTNNWTFSLDTGSLGNATHTLIAKATDSSGNTATSGSISIIVNNGSSPTATINWTDVHQQIDGFGAASAFTGTGITDSQADLFWSTSSGVGLSLLRTQIQPDGTYPESATMQKAQARGVKIWGAPWTPPANMKTNNSLTNGGSLLAIDYQAYANYLSQYVLTLKNSYGISLYALSVQNEPDFTATYRSCTWTAQNIHDFILNNLGPTMASSGLTTKIMASEPSQWGRLSTYENTTFNDSAAAAFVGIAAAHNYDSSGNLDNASPYPLAQNQGKALWETEVATFDTFTGSMSNGLIWAQRINDWMTIANGNAWHYWWLIDGGNGDNEALLSPTGATTKRLFVMGNYSKFVRPGYVRIGATASPVGGVSISAYKDPSTGKFAIVAINHNGSNTVLNFALNGFAATSVTPWVTSSSLDLVQQTSITVGGSAFTATLPASSVTTFVGP